MWKNIFFVAHIVFLTGCAQPGFKAAHDALKTSQLCCEKFSEIGYENLTQNDFKSFKIWLDSPTFNFDSGKSYFKAFELSGRRDPIIVNIKSVFRRDVFFPIVTLLDDSFNVVNVVGPPKITYVPPGWENGYVGGEFEIDFTKNEKYLVIHTPEAVVSKKIKSKGPDVIPVVIPGGLLFLPGLGEFTHTYSYIGNIRIKTSTKGKTSE